MNGTNQVWRRALWPSRLIAVIAGAMFIFSLATSLSLTSITPADVARAAPLTPGAGPVGRVTLNPTFGTSETNFGMSFATPQLCPGNASTQGYRWHTFITPAGTDVASLVWSPLGAPQNGPGFTRNLFNDGGSAVRNQFPADAPPGAVVGIPTNMELTGGGVFGPDPLIPIPPGEYEIGIVCVAPTDNVWRTERFWATPITITADAAGGVGQVSFVEATTTTTTSTTTSTTTTVAGETTTTVAGQTTTTSVGSTVSTTTKPVNIAVVAPNAGGPSGGSYSPTGSLPATGSSPTALIVWGLLLLVFGRIAMLLSRKTTVARVES